MAHTTRFILPFILTLSFSMPLFASSPCLTASKGIYVDVDTVQQLDEVVVSARTRSLIIPQQLISRQQIEALPSSSIADALKYMSGVQIKDYGGLGGQKTVNVRSLGSQHIGVYIDGVRITNAQNGTVDLGKYSLTTLESVSLYNANKSETLMMASEYASAATIYLQTHRPDSTSLTACGSIGSFGTYKAAATWMFRPQHSNLIGFVDAAYTTSKGNYPFAYHTQYEDTIGTRRNSDITMLRIESCLWWHDWQWHTYYFDSERGLPGGVVRRLSNTYTDVGREWDRNFFTQLSYKRQFGAWGVRGIAKYSNDWLHYRSDYPHNISVHSNNRYHQQDAYAAFATSFNVPLSPELGELRLSASTDLRYSNLTCNVRNFSYVYRLDHKTSLSTFYNYDRLNLNLGALYTNISDHTRGRSKPLSNLSYNAILSYTFGNFSLRTFYKSVFRAPTLNDLYYTLVGSRNLRPEYTQQLDFGATYTNSSVHGVSIDLQVDCYYNRIRDRIVCLPLKGSYQWTMLNYGYTRCLGINATANILTPFANNKANNQLMISASFQDDRDLTDRNENSYNDFIAYSPQLSLTAVNTLKYKNLCASLSHIYVGKRYWTAENAIEAPLKPYHCTDLKVSYTLNPVIIELECQNLLDNRYEIIQRWPMPGRRYTATIKLRL